MIFMYRKIKEEGWYRMQKKKVSINVAIYKSEQFLPKLIESIIEQTYKNLEIILVDDGSPDGSGKICDDYAERDNRIKVIHKKNGGACEARNYGINAASGDYIAIVDGDDWLEKDFVEYLLGIVEKTGSDMALSDKIFTTRDRTQTENDQIETWTPEHAAAAIIYPKMEIGPWNKLYSMSLIKNNNISFSVPWSGEGLYFASMAAQHANKVGVGHRKIYNYRLNNANSGLTNYNVQLGINALWNIKNIKDNIILNSSELDDAIDNHIWRNYYFLIFLIVATNTKHKYSKEYSECKKEMRRMLPDRIRHSKGSIKDKIGMVCRTFAPDFFAQKSVKERRIALEKDRME